MLRGVTGINQTKVSHFLPNAKAKANIGKNMELPSKIALSTLGIFGVADGIKGVNAPKNEHVDRYCGSDFACSLLY